MCLKMMVMEGINKGELVALPVTTSMVADNLVGVSVSRRHINGPVLTSLIEKLEGYFAIQSMASKLAKTTLHGSAFRRTTALTHFTDKYLCRLTNTLVDVPKWHNLNCDPKGVVVPIHG